MLSIIQTERDLKRQRSLPLDQSAEFPAAKKPRRDSHQAPWVPSERFWDTLPKIYLTRQALSEYDRRSRKQSLQAYSESSKKAPRRSARLSHLATEKLSSPALKRFACGGGPDLTAICGFPAPTMSDQTSRYSRTTSGPTTSGKRSGPYDKNYELKLSQAGIYLTEEIDENDDVVLPANYDEITSKLSNARRSLSPSRFTEKDFQRFRRQTEHEILEGDTMSKSMATIEGISNHFSRSGGQFNNLEPFNPQLAVAVPDSYDGARPLSIDHRVLNDLGPYIVPSTDTSRPAVPNFFLEGKSTQGRADVGKRQAAYTGAIGARGMTSLQNYPSRAPTYDNNAYTFTSIYHDGQLKMYTSHATAPKDPEEDERPRYHMTQLGAFAMTHNSKTFREGATYYRNARDFAKRQRDASIQQANQMARQLSTSKHSHRRRTTMTVTTKSMSTSFQGEEGKNSSGTDTSVDELALDKAHKRSRRVVLNDDDNDDDDGNEADLSQMSFMTAVPAVDRDISAQPTSQPVPTAGSRRVKHTTSLASHNPSRVSSLYSSPTGHAKPASRVEHTRSSESMSPDPLTDDTSLMSSRTSPEADDASTRRRK